MKETATFAGGCFWCTEAIFSNLKGVSKVMPGYAGGYIPNPSYEQVCSGTTGHAESIQITFDPKAISYKDLVYVFLKTHDPTQLNRQGQDIGNQYRSVIFYKTPEQKQTAESQVIKLKNDYEAPIVTEITPFKNFYPAENYHRDFYKHNRNKPYCRLVIDPKLQKFRKDFKKYLK